MSRGIPQWFAGPLAWGRLGVTGSQHGATPAQQDVVRRLLAALVRHAPLERVGHGDCVGVDAWVHGVALELGCNVDIYPPTNEAKRAFCTGDEGRVTIHPPAPYLVRNKLGVAGQADALLAVPRETSRGTWHCLGCAQEIGLPQCIVRADGTVEWRHGRQEAS